MKARPLGNYCAVQPDDHTTETSSGIILTKSHSVTPEVVFGTVLMCGRDVIAVSPGDRVVYESQAAIQSNGSPLQPISLVEMRASLLISYPAKSGS